MNVTDRPLADVLTIDGEPMATVRVGYVAFSAATIGDRIALILDHDDTPYVAAWFEDEESAQTFAAWVTVLAGRVI